MNVGSGIAESKFVGYIAIDRGGREWVERRSRESGVSGWSVIGNFCSGGVAE